MSPKKLSLRKKKSLIFLVLICFFFLSLWILLVNFTHLGIFFFAKRSHRLTLKGEEDEETKKNGAFYKPRSLLSLGFSRLRFAFISPKLTDVFLGFSSFQASAFSWFLSTWLEHLLLIVSALASLFWVCSFLTQRLLLLVSEVTLSAHRITRDWFVTLCYLFWSLIVWTTRLVLGWSHRLIGFHRLRNHEISPLFV